MIRLSQTSGWVFWCKNTKVLSKQTCGPMLKISGQEEKLTSELF